jgi:hypothetical protein
MSFRNLDKKKAYEQGHKKQYDKEFIQSHRKEWNEYQNNYKKKKRLESGEKIKDEVRHLNIADEESLTSKAAVVLLIILFESLSKPGVIARRTGYSLSDVRIIFKNWSTTGIYEDGKIIMEDWQSDLELEMQVALISMAGAGEIKRMTVPLKGA